MVVSYDGSIVYIMDAEDHWLREFKSGEAKIYVDGHFDLLDNNIYLGARVEGHDW